MNVYGIDADTVIKRSKLESLLTLGMGQAEMGNDQGATATHRTPQHIQAMMQPCKLRANGYYGDRVWYGTCMRVCVCVCGSDDDEKRFPFRINVMTSNHSKSATVRGCRLSCAIVCHFTLRV